MLFHPAVIAQLGERQTEDLKVPGSIPGRGRFLSLFSNFNIQLNEYETDPYFFLSFSNKS